MLELILLGVLVVVVLFGFAVLRGIWQESAKKIDALPSKQERRTWPLASAVGERVMWCPILASKVVIGETMVEEGSLGTVTTLEGGRPVVAFDAMPGRPALVDKWGAARVVPKEHDVRPVRGGPAATSRTGGAKNAKKKRRR